MYNIHPSGNLGLVICCPTTSHSSQLSVSEALHKVRHPLVTNVIQMCNKGTEMSWKPTLCCHGNQYMVRVTLVRRIHLLKLYTQHLNQNYLQYRDSTGASTLHYIARLHFTTWREGNGGISPPQSGVYLSKFN